MNPSRVSRKVCLACSAGGHFEQMRSIRRSIGELDAYFLTVANAQTSTYPQGTKIYFVQRILKNPASLLVNFLQSLAVFLKERPDVVVTTGSGEAVPTFVIACCLGRRTVLVESFARVRSPSHTGRILRHFADIVLVQWEELLPAYPHAMFVGPYFRQRLSGPLNPPTKILVTVGTQTRGFDRLIKAMDSLGTNTNPDVEVVAQIGTSEYEPLHMKWFRFLPSPRFQQMLEWADVIVTHSGAGLIGRALEMGKRVVVVPRNPEYGESLWAFDAELPAKLAGIGVVRIASVDNLSEVLKDLNDWTPRLLPGLDFERSILQAVNA